LVRTPYSPAVGELALHWGAQVDARPLRASGDSPDDDAVAAYVAKYVTQGASETGAGVDHPVTAWADVESAPVSEHVRALMRACWRLGDLPEYASLRLRDWTHTLGYRGHILIRSRAYSTTYAALRADRANYLGNVNVPDPVIERHWRYVGSGHTPGTALIANRHCRGSRRVPPQLVSKPICSGAAHDTRQRPRMGPGTSEESARVE
jgi:hypothetical protein